MLDDPRVRTEPWIPGGEHKNIIARKVGEKLGKVGAKNRYENSPPGKPEFADIVILCENIAANPAVTMGIRRRPYFMSKRIEQIFATISGR